MKKIKAQVRIGRYMNSDTHYLKVECQDSHAQFLELEFDAEQFSNLLNQSIAYMSGKARALDVVGKKCITKPFDVILPPDINAYDKKKIEEYLKEYKPAYEEANPGYILDTYIGSQKSVTTEVDVMHNKKFAVAHLRTRTYVEVKDEEKSADQ